MFFSFLFPFYPPFLFYGDLPACLPLCTVLAKIKSQLFRHEEHNVGGFLEGMHRISTGLEHSLTRRMYTSRGNDCLDVVFKVLF